jgi:UDP-N-acetyl-D-glucosamine/UDP-N-acetyl-D-galactosamine dehydrogenase
MQSSIVSSASSTYVAALHPETAAIDSQTTSIAVIGVGYAGLPLAIALKNYYSVVGFDCDNQRVAELSTGCDKHNVFTAEQLASETLSFTANSADISSCNFYIVVVPTPVTAAKEPDLSPLMDASRTIGRHLKKGDIVVYESTVYPGVTEDYCVPVLEKESGLSCGIDFSVGYSPERINVGDQDRTITNTTKVIAARETATLDRIATVYNTVTEAGLCRVSGIKVAEAPKIVENIQRDVNIALMNELAMAFDSLGIDTNEVLAAAGTKWNFAPFRPGLVGGHCISVDPYYLIHRTKEAGFVTDLIQCSRMVNNRVPKFIVEKTVKLLIKAELFKPGCRVGVLGLSFKENCPDVRDTRVIDILHELESYGIKALVYDPIVNPAEASKVCEVNLADWNELHNLSGMIVAVAHDQFRDISPSEIEAKLLRGGVVIDVKGIFCQAQFELLNTTLWQY